MCFVCFVWGMSISPLRIGVIEMNLSHDCIATNSLQLSRSSVRKVNEFGLGQSLIDYKMITFSPFSRKYLHGLSRSDGSGINLKELLKLQLGSSFFTTNKRVLFYLEQALSEQLAHPSLNLNIPILDKLWLTVGASDDDIQRFNVSLKKKLGFAYIRHGFFRKEDKNLDFYKNLVSFIFPDGEEKEIDVYYELKQRGERKHRQNPLKIAFNPARFSKNELKVFFSWLKGIFPNYESLFSQAKVTRADIAVDLFGVPNPMLLVLMKNGQKCGFEYNRSFPKLVGTQVLGQPAKSHFDIYDRNQKILDKNAVGCFLQSKEGMPISVTRIERVFRSQSDHTNICLGSLEQVPCLFKYIDILSPRLLLTIESEKQMKVVAKKGFNWWFTQRRRQTHSSLPQYNLEQYSMFINIQEYEALQRKVLRGMRRIILKNNN